MWHNTTPSTIENTGIKYKLYLGKIDQHHPTSHNINFFNSRLIFSINLDIYTCVGGCVYMLFAGSTQKVAGQNSKILHYSKLNVLVCFFPLELTNY